MDYDDEYFSEQIYNRIQLRAILIFSFGLCIFIPSGKFY